MSIDTRHPFDDRFSNTHGDLRERIERREALRQRGADLCFIALKGAMFLASSYLMALGLPLLFFLLLSGGHADALFGHIANLAERFLAADVLRRANFLSEFKTLLIGAATLVVIARLPRFIRDLDRELSGEML